MALPPFAPYPLYRVADVFVGSGQPADLSDYLGEVFRLETHDTRVSVSLVDGCGEKVCWFRKEGVPAHYWAEGTCARVVKNGIELNGRIVDAPAASPPKTMQQLRDEEVCERGYVGQMVDYEQRLNRAQIKPQPPQGSAMTITNAINQAVNANKSAAAQAAYFEAGRIANNQAAKLAVKHLPLMLKGYADTAAGKLVLANIASVAIKQLRPNDLALAKLAEAMQVQAYQELYQQMDIEGIFESLLSSPEMKSALAKVAPAEEA